LKKEDLKIKIDKYINKNFKDLHLKNIKINLSSLDIDDNYLSLYNDDLTKNPQFNDIHCIFFQNHGEELNTIKYNDLSNYTTNTYENYKLNQNINLTNRIDIKPIFEKCNNICIESENYPIKTQIELMNIFDNHCFFL